MSTLVLRPSDLETPYCAPGNPPFRKGEHVCLGDGRVGTVTRAYSFENKYTIKVAGTASELRGPDGAFLYFRKDELQRAVPVAQPPDAIEPVLKQARVDGGVADDDTAMTEAAPTVAEALHRRLEGRVKWFSKERGYGKIEPLALKGQQPGEEVFVHKKQMDGGPDGPHAQVIAEGVFVSYELITLDEKPCATCVQVRGIAPTASVAEAGRRDPNQDAMVQQLLLSGLHVGNHQITGQWKVNSEDRFLSRVGVPMQLGEACKKSVCSLFGVFDGHSGASCSDFVAVGLDKAVFDCLRQRGMRDQSVASEATVKSALLAAFRTTEHNFFQYVNKLEGGAASAWATAGSTACTALLYGPDEEGRLRLVVANAGDSRAVLGKRDCRAVRLSEDHTPDVPSERKRIEQEGASVVQVQSIWRIVLPSRRGSGMAGLSVSRGFGDLEYKNPAGIVSAVPDIFMRTVDPREDSIIILASDGVWGPIDDAEAVRIVVTALREGGDHPARTAAQRLTEAAHQREPSDDKTALIVWFGDMPDAPQVAATSAPTHGAALRMKPRHMAAATAGDDMFAVKAQPKTDLDELDDLFSAYARDLDK